MKIPRIYLASTSPRRVTLLQKLGLPFTQISPDGAQEVLIPADPVACALQNSENKARAVLPLYTQGLVISADTIVVLHNTIYGKPSSPEEAVEYLSALSGHTHQVITGVTVARIEDASFLSEHALTHVSFRQLSLDEIERYVATRECFDKAGAYAIQERASLFIDSIHGCYTNVIGLPLVTLNRLLNKHGVSIHQFWG